MNSRGHQPDSKKERRETSFPCTYLNVVQRTRAALSREATRSIAKKCSFNLSQVWRRASGNFVSLPLFSSIPYYNPM